MVSRSPSRFIENFSCTPASENRQPASIAASSRGGGV
jgi:hypothetical protein